MQIKMAAVITKIREHKRIYLWDSEVEILCPYEGNGTGRHDMERAGGELVLTLFPLLENLVG